MSVDVVTFGCRLNAAESEVIRREAERAGLTETVVVNTCRSPRRRFARRASDPGAAPRAPAGQNRRQRCAAQTEPQTFVAMAEVDQVLATRKSSAPRVDARAPRLRDRRRPEGDRQRHHGGQADRRASDRRLCRRSRAFVQVQNGCDHRCTFCIIPYAAAIHVRCRWAPVVDDVRGFASTAIARSCSPRRYHELWRGPARRARLGML